MIKQLAPILMPLMVGTASAQVVINEVDYDQPGTDNAEYIEILNTGSSAFPLQYLQVVLVNGNAGGSAVYATLENVSWPALLAGEFFVICANAGTPNCDAVVTPATNLIQNGSPDAIALVITQPEPMVLDALSYGGSVPGYTEGTGTSQEDSNLTSGISIGRLPDGADTGDNNADFQRMCSTPGTANLIDLQVCDIDISVLENSAASPSFIVVPSPDGQGLLAFDPNLASEPITFQLLSANGALIAEGTAASPRASWHVGLSALHGHLLLVRLSTPTRQEVRRFILP